MKNDPSIEQKINDLMSEDIHNAFNQLIKIGVYKELHKLGLLTDIQLASLMQKNYEGGSTIDE